MRHLWLLIVMALVFSSCGGQESVDCTDLFVLWWWPLAARGEFGDPLPETLPSEDAMVQIDEAVKIDTGETWPLVVEAWREVEPASFHATCDLFSAGERYVLEELNLSEASECYRAAVNYYNPDPMAGPGEDIDSAAQTLGIDIPPAASIDYEKEAQAWADSHAEDFVSICLHILEESARTSG